jgi:hypothetical protein
LTCQDLTFSPPSSVRDRFEQFCQVFDSTPASWAPDGAYAHRIEMRGDSMRKNRGKANA